METGTAYLDETELHEKASRATGLDDFGDDEYLEGLRVLLDAYRTQAQLTELGRAAARAQLVASLTSRLHSQESWKRNPDHRATTIKAPIFVVGLPRTGTTALHRLLAQDPANQGLDLWLAEYPQPRPPRHTWPEYAGYRRCQAAFDQTYGARPELAGIHYMAAGEVDECWRLLRQSMTSVSFECLSYLPTFSAWLDTHDWTPAYQRYRDNLRLIGLNDPQRRWVLKNPSHMFAPAALFAAFPDALVVQTHRHPREVVPSVCSLNSGFSQGWSEVFTGEVLGRAQLDMWAKGINRFMRERERRDPQRFFDVDYSDFVRDPVDVVERMYRHFGLELSEQASRRMRDLHGQRAGGKGTPHRYTLDDFGLDGREVDERFAEYTHTYNVTPGHA